MVAESRRGTCDGDDLAINIKRICQTSISETCQVLVDQIFSDACNWPLFEIERIVLVYRLMVWIIDTYDYAETLITLHARCQSI